MKIPKYIIVCLWLIPSLMTAQNLSSYKENAQKAFQEEDYDNAYFLADEILKAENEENNIDFLFIAGKSAFEVRGYQIAEKHLKKLINLDQASKYPEAYLVLADTYYRLGAYDKVIQYCEDYMGKDFNNEYLTNKAQQMLKSCKWAQKECLKKNPSISVTKVGVVNTYNSDFPISYTNRNLQYASYILPNEAESACNCSMPCDYQVLWKRFDFGNGSSQETSDFNEASTKMKHLTFAGNNHRVYYIDCECDNKVGDNCALFYRDQTPNNNWTAPVKLPNHINLDNYTIKDPLLVSDPVSGIDTLYFVSDRPEGKGGDDIWYTVVKQDSFGVPQNFHAVNTPLDEATPFYSPQLQTFYFSSNGLYTFGGFDIFSIPKGCDATSIKNLGCQINSSFDDLYFMLDETGQEGVFSSNRDGVLSNDNDFPNCCPDIFKATVPNKREIDLVVRTYNKLTKEPLEGVNVELKNLTENYPLGTRNDADSVSYYYGKVPLDKIFEATGTLEGYYSDTTSMPSSFDDCIDPTTLYLDLFLEPQLNIIVTVKDLISNEPINGAIVFITDTTKTDEIYSAFVGQEEPANTFYFNYDFEAPQIKFDRVYSFSTFHPESANEFVSEPDVFFLNTRELEKVPQTITIPLYLFEPLPLYFDNAIPSRERPRNEVFLDTVASNDYQYYYNRYHDAPVVKQNFKVNATYCNDRYATDESIETFFDNIELGKQRLDTLAEIMWDRIANKGYTVTLTIYGFASPLGDENFNISLSKRRTDSMQKYLRQYFREKGDEDKFVINETVTITLNGGGVVPAGDDCGSSSNRDSRKCCTQWGIKASEARRVEIKGINFNPPPGLKDFIISNN